MASFKRQETEAIPRLTTAGRRNSFFPFSDVCRARLSISSDRALFDHADLALALVCRLNVGISLQEVHL